MGTAFNDGNSVYYSLSLDKVYQLWQIATLKIKSDNY